MEPLLTIKATVSTATDALNLALPPKIANFIHPITSPAVALISAAVVRVGAFLSSTLASLLSLARAMLRPGR